MLYLFIHTRNSSLAQGFQLVRTGQSEQEVLTMSCLGHNMQIRYFLDTCTYMPGTTYMAPSAIRAQLTHLGK